MDLANLVEGFKELQAVCPSLAIGSDLDRNTLFKVDRDILRSGGRGQRIVSA
jgi:hypothetical protein